MSNERTNISQHQIAQQQDSFGLSDDFFKNGTEEQLVTLMTEQNSLKLEIQKLSQQQKEIENKCGRTKERFKAHEGKKEDVVTELLVRQFIQNSRGKIDVRSNETTKKRKLRTSVSGELVCDEEDGSRQNFDRKEQVERDGQSSSPPMI